MRMHPARKHTSTMIDALSKGLNQKPAMIKGMPPVTPSRAFALWLVLLVLYFLILPSAAESPQRESLISLGGEQTMSVAPPHRQHTPARRRP